MKKKWLIVSSTALLLSSYLAVPIQVFATENLEETITSEEVSQFGETIPIQKIEYLFANNRTTLNINTNKENLTFYSQNPEMVSIGKVSSTGVNIGSYINRNYALELFTGQVGTTVVYALDENNVVDPNSGTLLVVSEFDEGVLNSQLISDEISIKNGEFYKYQSNPGEPSTMWYVVNPSIIEADEHVTTTISYGPNGKEEYQSQILRLKSLKTGNTEVYGFQNGEHVKSFSVTVEPIITTESSFVNREIPFETIYKEDASLIKDEEVIINEGTLGISEDEYLVTFEDGVEVTRELVDSKVIQNPISKIVSIGTSVPVESIQLDKTELNLEKGQEYTLLATILPKDTNSEVKINWESSDSSVATVDEQGKVIAVDGGTTNITANIGDIVAVATVTVKHAALYEDYPVSYAWDFGVWSHYKNGTKVASSFNDFAGKKLTIVKEEKDSNNSTWVLFQSDGKTIGWVNKTGLRSQLPKTEVLYKDIPVADAWNYGVWTNYENGTKLSGSLNNYRGKELKIIKEAIDSKGASWVQFQVGDRVIGWISQWGLKENPPSNKVLYTDTPVVDARNYSIFDNELNSIGTLESYLGKTLEVTAEAEWSNGQQVVQISFNKKEIGWVSPMGLVGRQAELPIILSDTPVKDAWNYGIWTDFQGGKKLNGSLNNLKGKSIEVIQKVIDENGNTWMKFRVDKEMIGWVSSLGLEYSRKIESVFYMDTPVKDGWNFGIWSRYENGTKKNGTLNDYQGKNLMIFEEAIDKKGNAWVHIQLDENLIGWVSKFGLQKSQQVEVLYKDRAVKDAWNYGVWDNYQNGKKIPGSLNNYASEELAIIEEKTDSKGMLWVKFQVKGKTIGWVSKQGIISGEKKEKDYYYSVLPVSNSWNYGIWSNYQNGKKLGNLNSYAGKYIRVVNEVKVSPNNIWVQFFVEDNIIGWVSKKGLGVTNPNVFILYSSKPVKNAWDYGIWTKSENGTKIAGSLNNYAGKTLNITEETVVKGTKMVKFEYHGRVIGWVAKKGLQ